MAMTAFFDPENKFITLDIYVCNLDVNLQKIVDEISNQISFEKVEQRILPRGKIGTKTRNDNLILVYFVTVLVAW